MKLFLPAILVITASVHAAASPNSCTGWAQVTTPVIGFSDNVLAAIAANSATDIWVAGSYAPDRYSNLTRTLMFHYDGSAWTLVNSPNIGSKANQFFGVAAASGRAWAVGSYIDETFGFRSLIEAWDGARWSVVPSPAIGVNDLLFAVSASSATNVWAVGFFQDADGVYENLTEHFDGSAWSVVPSPSTGETGNQLQAVLAVSPNDVWAAGEVFGNQGPDQSLIEHWDGSNWSVLNTPINIFADNLIYGVAPTASGLLAVGSTQNNVQSPRTFVEVVKNGVVSLQYAVNPNLGENDFFGVTSVAGTNVSWAVGTTQDPATGNLLSLIERHDLTNGWVPEQSPSPGLANGNTQLAGVLALSPTEAWAVGSYDGVNAARPLILQRCQ